MPPIFKNKRKRLRALMSSVLPASILNSLGTESGTKSLPPLGEQMSVRSWIRLVHMGIRPWDSESVEIWEELNGYRLDKAHHAKLESRTTHEFIICEFSNEKNRTIELRFDRSAGERKDNDSINSVPSSTTTTSSSATGKSSHINSSGGSSHSSPRGSLLAKPFSSIKARMSRSSASLQRKASHSSHSSQSSLPRASGISLQQHLASDAVTRIKNRPDNAQILKTLLFSGDPALRPNLCDLMVLVDVLYNESEVYMLLNSQCYWHADTIFAILEMWALEHNNGVPVSAAEKKIFQASTGSYIFLPVFRRDPNQVERIWVDFMRGRRLIEEKRAEYERTSKEENRRRFSKEQDDRERHLTSQLRKEQEVKEQQLKKDQEERERQLKKDQEERERQLKKDQEERERQLKKDQEERERQLKKDQEEKERQLKKDQEARERRLRKEQEDKEQRLRKEQEEKEQRSRKVQQERERRLRKELKKEQEENEQRLRTELRKEQEEKERMKKEQDELKQQVLDQQRQMQLLLRLIGPAPINVSSPPTASISLPDNHP